jgi:hypothetical protein
MADCDSTRKSSLRRNHDMVSDLAIVGDVDHVVELHSVADDGGAQCRPINACVGSDFDVIANLDVPDLWELMPNPIGRNEPKSVSSDHSSRVDDRSIANRHAVIQGHARMKGAAFANLHSLAD